MKTLQANFFVFVRKRQTFVNIILILLTCHSFIQSHIFLINIVNEMRVHTTLYNFTCIVSIFYCCISSRYHYFYIVSVYIFVS